LFVTIHTVVRVTYLPSVSNTVETKPHSNPTIGRRLSDSARIRQVNFMVHVTMASGHAPFGNFVSVRTVLENMQVKFGIYSAALNVLVFARGRPVVRRQTDRQTDRHTQTYPPVL